MINYIIGIIIVIPTIYILFRQFKKFKEGKPSCDNSCSQCKFNEDCSNNSDEKK